MLEKFPRFSIPHYGLLPNTAVNNAEFNLPEESCSAVSVSSELWSWPVSLACYQKSYFFYTGFTAFTCTGGICECMINQSNSKGLYIFVIVINFIFLRMCCGLQQKWQYDHRGREFKNFDTSCKYSAQYVPLYSALEIS